MSDQQSREEASTGASVAPGTGVDDDLKRRLRAAYLNDEADELVVTGVRTVGDRVVVEFEPPHGEATHVERFAAPREGSLAECPELLAFLEAAGVSPLRLDDLVGTRVPATYDPEAGWRIGEAFRPGSDGGTARIASASDRLTGWLWTYRYWLVAVLFVGGELAFAAVLVLLFA